MPQLRRNVGFTIVELLSSLAILSLLLMFAVPSMARMLAEADLRARSSALSVALASARLRAVETGRTVSVCAREATGACRPSADWSRGWLVFDNPRRRGQPETPTAVRTSEPIDAPHLVVSSTGGRRILAFRPDGTSSGSNVTLTLCDRRHPQMGRQIVVNNVGRVRSGPLPVGWSCASPAT
jgi:type IV fimbrial biogenesis protein FimT